MESPKITKGSATLISDYYENPKTSKLTFTFEPELFSSIEERLSHSLIHHASIDEKELYLFDGFFEASEGAILRGFFKAASFSRKSYGSPESIEKGEKPAGSMNNEERWKLFFHPPGPIYEIYKLLSTFAKALDAEVFTLPWELCHGTTGSPSVIANYHDEISFESMDLGKHQDCNPSEGVLFGIPILYRNQEGFHSKCFENGSPGKPWMVSLMLYVTEENFLPEYQMGTLFYHDNHQIALRANCTHTRLVLFEGDIFHTPEASLIPKEVKTWRISYVFKLIMNPKKEDVSLKEAFYHFLKKNRINELSLGEEMRI